MVSMATPAPSSTLLNTRSVDDEDTEGEEEKQAAAADAGPRSRPSRREIAVDIAIAANYLAMLNWPLGSGISRASSMLSPAATPRSLRSLCANDVFQSSSLMLAASSP